MIGYTDMNQQEIFTKVKDHLLSQNQKSEIKEVCLYRHGDLKCAAGVLIPDELYEEDMEHQPWGALIGKYPELKAITNVDGHRLIHELQAVHDSYEPCFWENVLGTIEWKY